MGASVDCEAIGSGFLSQPINSLTSLVLVIAGAVVFAQYREVWLSASLAAAGIGSFLFHGPLAPGGEWIHDVTLAWLISVVAVRAAGGPGSWALGTLFAVGSLFLVAPSSADPVTGLLTVVAVIAVLRGPWQVALPPLGLLAVSAIAGRLGTAGSRLCNPQSILQTHALWHTGAAAAVVWWFARNRSELPDPAQ